MAHYENRRSEPYEEVLEHEFRVIGPPGCGKTTWLAQEAEKVLNRGESVLVGSFSRADQLEVVVARVGQSPFVFIFAKLHQRGVDRYAIKPGANLGLAPKPLKIAVCGKKGVLGRFLGVGVIAQNPVGQVVYEVTILFYNAFEFLFGLDFHSLLIQSGMHLLPLHCASNRIWLSMTVEGPEKSGACWVSQTPNFSVQAAQRLAP